MEQEKIIQALNYNLEFSREDEQWIAIATDFGGFENIEFTIDMEKQIFEDKEWEKLHLLIDFFEVNLSSFVERSISPLKSFAANSGYFSIPELEDIDFDFLNWVQIIDNTYSANDYNWQFELEFSIRNKKNSFENIDSNGRWTITFSGKCVSGIRRITW